MHCPTTELGFHQAFQCVVEFLFFLLSQPFFFCAGFFLFENALHPSVCHYDRIRGEWMRDVKAAARLFDAAATHFQRTGIVAQANIGTIANVLTDLEELKYCGSVNRADNVAILNYANENFESVVKELFGGMPQCGLLEE